MKQLITILLLVLIAFVPMANAQFASPTYAVQSLSASSMPTTLATTVVTNLASPPVIDVRKQKEVTIVFSFNQASASTSNVVYALHGSLDGTYYDATRAFIIVAPSEGATRVNYRTNINVGGLGYLKLYAISNATALTTMTNFGVTYGLKIGAE
jgi:hypothetical protein